MPKTMQFEIDFPVDREGPDGREIEVMVTAHFIFEDVGIGSYEYWGAPGNDVRWEIELEWVDGPKEYEATPEEEEEWIKVAWEYVIQQEERCYES